MKIKHRGLRTGIYLFAAGLVISAGFLLNHRNKEKAYHQELYGIVEEIYKENGFTGKIEPIKARHSYLPSNVTIADYYYVEKIEGRKVKLWQSLSFKGRTKTLADSYQQDRYVKNGEYEKSGVFRGIEKVAFQQPRALELKKQMEQAIQPVFNWENFEYREIDLYFSYGASSYRETELQLPNIVEEVIKVGNVEERYEKIRQDYQEEIKANQEAKRPFQGYYTIDVDKYIKAGFISTTASYILHLEEDPDAESQYERVQAFHRQLDEQFKKIDFTMLQDGSYQISFDIHEGSSRSGNINDSIDFQVKDGKLVKAIDRALGPINL